MTEENLNFNDLDLTNTDTSMPLLAGGLYKFTVSEIAAVDNKKKTGQNLKIKLKLEETVKDTRGGEVHAGYPIFDTTSLVKTEKFDPRRRLAEFQEAVLGTKGHFLPLDQYLGKEVWAKVVVESSEEYGDQNRVSRYVKPKEA